MTEPARHFGRTLRHLRIDRGLSLRELAAAANISKSKLQMLETQDGRNVDEQDATRLDQILRSGVTLGAAAQRDRTAMLPRLAPARAHGPNRYTDLAVSLLHAGIEPRGVSAVDRRTFLQGASASVAIPAALALEATRHGLGIALSDRLDNNTDDWEEIVQEHGYGYMSTPPEQLVESLAVDMVALQYALPPGDTGAARDLRRIAALMATLMAMTLANLGHLNEARRWWRTSRKLADASTDIRTIAWVRGREIVRGLYENRPIGAVLSLVDAFETRFPDAPREALPELIGSKAQALALAGRADEANASVVLLGELYSELPHSMTSDGLTTFSWPEHRLRFAESFVYSFGGDYVRADEAQRTAIALYPETHTRGPAQIELQRALCLARMGDTTQALRHAEQTLTALPPADRIRPIVDLGQRVLSSIAPAEHERPEALAYRDLLRTTTQIEA
ncbi:hypothetical protein GCM10012284_53290 [Mangrovihabitans endophyticus]|uniref:HTH cro/C1-type domain-containing protein n=2 Tax=Mangrovihabitans endophyticus TaxID=1751298 RepID=A0A8J3C5D7_9ACTN|nr:hypothetical protein GCM10012284_53290 [Mangrovihabitans endophyticus]